MSKILKYLSKAKNFNFENMIDTFEKKATNNIIEGANLLLESYPEFEDEIIHGNIFQVSVAVLTDDNGIDIFDFLSLNPSFESFTKMTKREIIKLNRDVYEINAKYILNNGYSSKAYILRVKNLGEFKSLLYNYQTELESFPVYFGNKPNLKNTVAKDLHAKLLECQLDVYYNKEYSNSYPTFLKCNSKDNSLYGSNILSASNNIGDSESQGEQLQGFPNAKTLAKESVQGLLQNTLRSISIATQLGKTSIKIVDPSEIEFIFFNVENLELMGYEVAYDYDNHLDIDDDQLWVEDMHAAFLTWSQHMHSRN